MSRFDELTRSMCQAHPPSELWRRFGLAHAKRFLPELAQAAQVFQRDGTVFDHTMRVLDLIAPRSKKALWAALMHDLGKVSSTDGDTFIGHPMVGAAIARQQLVALGAREDFADDISRIVGTHMNDISHHSPRAARQFVARVGPNNIQAWCCLRRADSRAYGYSRAQDIVQQWERYLFNGGYLEEPVSVLPLPEMDQPAPVIMGVDLAAGSVPAMVQSPDRISWDDFYMTMAFWVARRSPDPTTKHGAIIAGPDHKPLSFGYNGYPRNSDDARMPKTRPDKYLLTLHAEENAILNASADLSGATVYVSGEPCSLCWARMLQKGIATVVIGPKTSACVDENAQRATTLLLGNRDIEIRHWTPCRAVENLHLGEMLADMGISRESR